MIEILVLERGTISLPTRGSRLITVEAQVYRWNVSPNDGWIEIIVERNAEPSQRLVARTDYRDSRGADGIHFEQQTRITPSFVRRAILSALAAGWNPSTPGKPFTLDIAC